MGPGLDEGNGESGGKPGTDPLPLVDTREPRKSLPDPHDGRRPTLVQDPWNRAAGPGARKGYGGYAMRVDSSERDFGTDKPGWPHARASVHSARWGQSQPHQRG